MDKVKKCHFNHLQGTNCLRRRDLMAADICVLEEDTFTKVCMRFVDCISIIR